MFRECLLGDVLTLKRGYDLPSQDRIPGSIPIVSSSGVTGAHIEAKVKGPGVVTGRYGTLGEVHFLAQDFWPLNTTLYVRDFKGSDPRFIAYFLQTLDFASRSAAAAVPGINRNALHRLPVRCPDLATQRRIASILSAYDDLIENNARRIAILEEMARRIYEEWFVRFRFPGHEGVRMVESEVGVVPEGWALDTLKGVCVSANGIQTGPFGSQLHKADYSEVGVPVLMPKDLIAFRINADTVARVPEATAASLSRHRMQLGDIVYGRRGDIGRRAFIMAHQSGWLCVSTPK